MGLRLLRRCAVWCPTWFGWFVIGALLIIPLTWWFAFGESFLALTQRYPAEVLVVEGWIGRDGVRAAEAEFQRLGYQYIVATGNPEHEGWEDPLSSYAEMAERELIRSGVPSDRIIVAPARDTQRQRTYESAVAAQRALQAKGIRPQALNVFTKGPHARRSRLVFAKIFGPATKVGVVSWSPAGDAALPWWQSSNRAKDLLTETAGYAYEALLDSGRGSRLPRGDVLPVFLRNSY